jgi:hypothetical protein
VVVVVVAVAADRLSELGVVLAVAVHAAQRHTVAAGFEGAAGTAGYGPARLRRTSGVHGTEAGSGEGAEHGRVPGHRLRYALAAGQAG